MQLYVNLFNLLDKKDGNYMHRINYVKQWCVFLFALSWFGCSYAVSMNLQPITSANQESFLQVQTVLAKADNLSGEFKQTQKIALLSHPLISTGKFTLSKNEGLEWNQTTPFHSKFMVTPSKIEQQIENNPATIITKEQQPIVFSFTNIFLSVFNGDTKTINNYFALTFAGDVSKWRIALKPLGAPLNKAIDSIELAGSKYVNAIVIHDAKGNQIVMQLFNIMGR